MFVYSQVSLRVKPHRALLMPFQTIHSGREGHTCNTADIPKLGNINHIVEYILHKDKLNVTLKQIFAELEEGRKGL